MAVPDPYKAAKKTIGDNQYKYLTNMAGGKTETGGVASTGQSAWAKDQLEKSSYVPDPVKAPTIKMSPAPPRPDPVKTPTIKMSPAPPSGPVKPQTVPAPAPTAPTNSLGPYQDWKTRTDELFSKLEQLSNAQFNYDPNTDPAYQGQRDLINQRVQDANRSAMEQANEKGILGSSITGEALLDNARRGELEAASYIPQYREQAYGQFQDRLSNAANLLRTASELRGYDDNLAMEKANITGSYLDPAAESKINRIIQLGEAWKTGTPEQQAQYSKEADQLRSELQGMGIDPSLFGADKTTEERTANLGKVGVQTMAAQNQQFNQSQQEWDNLFNQAQFDWQKAQQTWENAFQEKNFEQQMKEAAASRGLQWASLNQRDKEFIADQAFREKQFTYQKEQDALASRNKPSAELSVKESTNNFNIVLDDLNDPDITKEEARLLLEQNSALLNDSDYKKLNDEINSRF